MGPCAGGSSPAHSPHPRLPGIPSGGSLREVLPKHSGGSVADFRGLPFFPRRSTRAPERVCGSLNTTRAPRGQGRRFREARSPHPAAEFSPEPSRPVARSPFSRFRSCADFPLLVGDRLCWNLRYTIACYRSVRGSSLLRGEPALRWSALRIRSNISSRVEPVCEPRSPRSAPDY